MGKDQDLVQAVKEQDAVAVEKILAKNRNSKKIIGSVKRLNINQQDGDGMSVLHHAVLLGNADIIQALLDHGSLVDMKDAKGMRPLHYGAWQGHDRPVELLLGRGSSVNQASTADGTSPLHLACEHGHLDVVKKLLKSGADVAVANNQNRTPLDLACEFGRTRVVELLLDSEPCRHLLQDTSDDMSDNSRTTCLHLAARNGHVDIIRLLLRGGIDINRQTLQGTSLHEAAKYGKTDVVRLLLSCGIDVTRLNSYEQTALEIVNKFTATRAAKELKHMLHDASSGIRIPAVSTPEPPTGHAIATAAVTSREPNRLAAPQSTEQPTNAPLAVGGIFRGGHRNGLESHLAALSGGSSSFAKTGTKSSDLNSTKTTTTGNQLKPFPWNRSSPQPSPVDHVVHITTGGRVDDGFLPPPSPLAKVKVFSSQDAGIASHGSSFRSSGPQKSSSSVPSVGRQSPSSWNGLHHHHHHLTGCPDPTVEASHRMSSGSNSSGGGCSSSSTSSTPSHQTATSRQNRLSGQSCESGVSSSRQSYHSSSGSSQGSLDHLEESGYSSTVNVNELIQQGLSDTDVLHTWLSSLQLEELTSLFVDAGYDMPTISRMTPEDLTAIGITKPSIRKKLKSEISKLTINDGIPDARPKDLSEWLTTLHLDGYRHTLVKQGYGTLDTVTDLTWEDLEEIGIKKLGHQKKIMLAIDRLTRINSTLHRLSASCSSSAQSSSAETLNHPESFGFAGKFVPGISGSASSASAQPRVAPYEMPCPKSWKLRENGSGGVTVERSDRPGVMPSPAGLVEIHVPPNRQSPSLLQVSNMGSINHKTYPALPETSNESDVRTRPNARSTPPLLDGDATPTNERKNSDRNQRTIKFGSKVKGASREEPLNFYQVEPHIARENGFSSYSTLPRKFSGKRKMAGFDNSFVSDNQYNGGFNGNQPLDVSVMKESSIRDDLGHFPYVEGCETASNKRKKEPPPLPKRINSFKTDSRSLYGVSRDKPHLEGGGGGKRYHPPLTAGIFQDSASKASADLRLVASNNSRIVAGTTVSSQNTIRTSANLSPSDNAPRSNQTTTSDASGNKIANRGADWQDGRTNECTDDSSDSGLESRHSASSVSLESSGSGGAVESNTLPFANENVGTIKQRNPSAKPSILTTADGEPGKLNASLFENGSSTIRRNGHRASTEKMDNAEVPVPQFMLVNGEIVSEIAASNGNLPYGVSSDNVFNDIDGMLSGLTQELDEMLKLHG